jgi:ankyrin repeat protein
MKYVYFLLFTLCISTTSNGMKHSLEIKSATTPLTILPNDCLWRICTYINPTWNNWQKNSKNLRAAVNTIKSLILTNKSFSLSHIASLLHVNDANQNLFLLRSAQAGIPCLVRYTINNGANVNYSKKNEFQPLGGAIDKQNYLCARLLLTAGARTIESTPYFKVSHQPIHLTITKGDLKMTELLLEFKANPNEKTRFGYTPIKLAILYNHAAIAKLLFEKGAIVEQEDRSTLAKLLATLTENKL